MLQGLEVLTLHDFFPVLLSAFLTASYTKGTLRGFQGPVDDEATKEAWVRPARTHLLHMQHHQAEVRHGLPGRVRCRLGFQFRLYVVTHAAPRCAKGRKR